MEEEKKEPEEIPGIGVLKDVTDKVQGIIGKIGNRISDILGVSKEEEPSPEKRAKEEKE